MSSLRSVQQTIDIDGNVGLCVPSLDWKAIAGATVTVANNGPCLPCEGPRAVIESQADVDKYRGCRTLETLSVYQTNMATSLDLPNLKTIRGHVYVDRAAALTSVSLPALRWIGEYLYLDDNPALTSLSFPELGTVGAYIYIDGNNALNNLDLASLQHVEQYVYIDGNSALCVPSYDWQSIAGQRVTITNNLECR